MNPSIHTAGSAHQLRAGAFSLFGLVILLANAALTFLFGFTFCGDALGSAVLGGIMCALFFDLAAIAWYTVRQQRGLSSEQRALSNGLSLATIISSTLVSVIWVLMSIRLVDLSAWHDTIGVFGVVLVTLMAAANFLGLFAFQYFSPQERAIELDEERKSTNEHHRQQLIREVHTRTLARTNDILMGKIPALAEREAAQITREYLNAFDALDLLDEPDFSITPSPPEDEPLGGAAGENFFQEEEEPVHIPTPDAAIDPPTLPLGSSDPATPPVPGK